MKLSIARAIEAEHSLKIDYAKLVQSDDYAKQCRRATRVPKFG